MVLLDDKHLLFIEPSHKIKEAPVYDDITEYVASFMSRAKPNNDKTRGWHSCACGQAHSASETFSIILGQKKYITNSLALHYVEQHRSQIPEGEMNKIQEGLLLEKKVGLSTRKPKI